MRRAERRTTTEQLPDPSGRSTKETLPTSEALQQNCRISVSPGAFGSQSEITDVSSPPSTSGSNTLVEEKVSEHSGTLQSVNLGSLGATKQG